MFDAWLYRTYFSFQMGTIDHSTITSEFVYPARLFPFFSSSSVRPSVFIMSLQQEQLRLSIDGRQFNGHLSYVRNRRDGHLEQRPLVFSFYFSAFLLRWFH
jgi:hypothetical protein